MRLSLPALLLSFSAISSATFYVAQQESTDFSVGEGKAIQWDTTDFEDNLDLYVGAEDADEDDDNAGTKIASDYPNSGTFTFTPDKDYESKYGKKKKIWGKDKKGKKGKGKKLIIIIINKPGNVIKQPEVPTVVIPPFSQLPPTATLTRIATLTSVVNTRIIATETVKNPPIETPKAPVVLPPTTPKPPVVSTTVRPPVLVTSRPSAGNPGNGTVVRPTATGGTSPPIFTGAASVSNAKPLIAGGIMGVLALVGLL